MKEREIGGWGRMAGGCEGRRDKKWEERLTPQPAVLVPTSRGSPHLTSVVSQSPVY